MNQSNTLDLLCTEWKNRGWDSSTLNHFRMEMGEGDASGYSESSDDQGSGDDNAFGESGYSQMASGFLGRVPQEHRSILEPYIKQWDAGVTRRFQELQSQYAPFRDYDPDTVAQAMGIVQMIDENPWSVYGTLKQALLSGEFGEDPSVQQQDQGQLGTQQPAAQDLQQGGWESVPLQVQQEFQQVKQALMLLGQHVLGQNQQATQQAEQDQLNDYLSGLHNEYGDFDDQWVLLQIHNEQSYDNVEQHIGKWQEMVNSRQQQQQDALGGLPKLLGNNGGTAPMPMNSESVKGLSRGDTQSLVASVLEQAARARDGNG